jgi:peptidoglycan-N-acetylglucosamine deacetylase
VPDVDKPLATLSVDLDNLWSYLRTYGDGGWVRYPSFLELALPRALETVGDDLPATFFVVGRDAEDPAHGALLAPLGASRHEIGNHSYDHAPDFHLAAPAAAAADIARAETAIEAATGQRPRGFRGPSFRLSRAILDVLIARGYRYDASLFPTFAGPLARTYHFATSKLDRAGRVRQKDLFGSFSDGLRPLRPFHWELGKERLIEIPVTTMPLLRLPLHMTYVNFIADRSPRLAEAWFRAGLALCRGRGIAPSILLHATDFIGADDSGCPGFLPGMRRSSGAKVALLERLLRSVRERFEIRPLGEFAEVAASRAPLRAVVPRFGSAAAGSKHHD